ncbi:MAG: carboxypeptidase regulatory-like domain-containing protein [Rhodospirillaceae bacterium]
MSRSRSWILALVFMTVASAVFAQGNPTGTITGKVMDPDNLMLPGVTVTAESPVLQGARTAVTSANGDYIIPFLPAGDYTVTFELSGFGTLKQTISLKMADTLPVNVKLTVAAVSETVTVTGSISDTAMTPTVATTVKASTIENIPWGRTLDAATVLAPAAIGNGPGGNIMISGALSYDNLNLVNGVNVNENLRQQARPLYVEDAVQETKVSTGNISAEYGRFQGGVVNMITKSGGNNFSGSFRTTFTNDGWKALTPYPGDSNIDQVVPAYEMTFGGPIFKDKLWFFTSGRYQNNKTNNTMAYTGYNYTYATDDTRLEGKATYAPNARNNFKLSYFKRNVDYTNNSFGVVMDTNSLYNNKNRESLLAAGYQWVVTSNLFIDTQYSARRYDNKGTGESYTDLIKGTPIWDRSRGTRFSAATYCAVCSNAVDKKNNDDFYVKANYFLSTKSTGSHNFVAGFDYFDEMRMNNQNSVASGYRVQVRQSAIVGYDVYPIVVPGASTSSATYIDWRPVFEDTVGNHLTTYSTFLNDVWRMNGQVTVNLGLRFDQNSTKDQGGKKVGNDGAFSPRLGVTYDVKGQGKWIGNLGFGHYVGMFNTQIADAASAAGRESNYSYWYQGPPINTTGPPYKTSYETLQLVWDWFFANGGTDRPVRTSPTVPGVNTSVASGIRSSNSDEFTVGLARKLAAKGAVRVDYVYRKYHDFYGNYVNMGTGTVTDPRTGLTFNMTVVDNTNDVKRDYNGVSLQFDYRLRRDLTLAGNYMLSWSKGSVEGEDSTNGATRASANEYPEYRQAAWNYPLGYTNGDQRHKMRIWGTWELPVTRALGTFDLGVTQRFDSGGPYDHNFSIDSRPYVTNPGYLVPPSSVTYYATNRGAFHFDGFWRTDLSLSWNYKIYRKAQIFFRGVVGNVFNNDALQSFNTAITTAGMTRFDPFTTVPVEGVNYKKDVDYGKPASPSSYQAPRDFSFSVGFRF